jgi:hypothetical protein
VPRKPEPARPAWSPRQAPAASRGRPLSWPPPAQAPLPGFPLVVLDRAPVCVGANVRGASSGALVGGTVLRTQSPSGFSHRGAFGGHTLTLYLTLDLRRDLRPTNPRLPSSSDGSGGCYLGAASKVPTCDIGGMIQPLAAAKRLRILVTRAASACIARDVVVVAGMRAMARVGRKM